MQISFENINSSDDLDKYFKWNSPVTDSRVRAHEEVNKLALEFAKKIYDHVDDPYLRLSCLRAIQEARMLANNGIALKEYNALSAYV